MRGETKCSKGGNVLSQTLKEGGLGCGWDSRAGSAIKRISEKNMNFSGHQLPHV